MTAARIDSYTVILLVFVFVALATIPIAGGRFRPLLDVPVRWPLLALGAIGSQILIISLIPGTDPGLAIALHLGSYALVLTFLFANRGLPFVWLIIFGAALNVLAISANGGVMPASEQALDLAGRSSDPAGFANSDTLDNARLLLLGDVFALPWPPPLANVFSVGDLVIGAGAFLALHSISGSHISPSRKVARSPVSQGGEADSI